MKHLILAPFLLFVMAFSQQKIESEKSPLPCKITYCRADASIEHGNAITEFTFQLDNGRAANDSILMSYNGISKTLKPDEKGKVNLELKAGKYMFQFYYGPAYQEIYTDSILIKSRCRTGIHVTFQSAYEPTVAEKPVIYVYPDVTTAVNIKLNVNGQIGYTYPQYNSSWNFIADSDGTIHMNDKQYDYLFWDGDMNVNYDKVDLNTGFVVSKDSLTTFFEAKLSEMGLNSRESQDFITYWVPQMLVNENNFVHFMFTEEYGSVAQLNVTPAPDHVFRVFMLWNDAADMNTANVNSQQMEVVDRTGFTLVEWGGGKIGKRMNTITAK